MRRVLAPSLLALALLGTACRVVHRADHPPPVALAAVSREDALLLVLKAAGPEAAIRALDRRRFDFVLDRPAIEWFRVHGAGPEVVSYLEKRSLIDFEAVRVRREDEPPQYVDPRLGFEDFAGTRAGDRSYRSLDPWTGPSRLGRPYGFRRLEDESGRRRWVYDAPSGQRFELDPGGEDDH